MNYKMDIHCHTYPESTDAKQNYVDLMLTAKLHGVQYLSITNHDNIDNQEIFLKEANRQGLRYIKGVEVTATLEDTSVIGYAVDVDVLIYNYAWTDVSFKAFIKKYKEENELRFRQRQALLETKFSIDLKSAKADRNMADLLFQAGKFKSPRDAKQFIKYDPMMKPFAKKRVSLEETINEAKYQGATIIMAHPFRKTLKNLPLSQRLLLGAFTITEMQKLMTYYHRLGVDGLEPYHHENMPNNNYLVIMDYVKKNNLLLSIGSDRHDTREKDPTQFSFDITLDEQALEKTIDVLFKQ